MFLQCSGCKELEKSLPIISVGSNLLASFAWHGSQMHCTCGERMQWKGRASKSAMEASNAKLCFKANNELWSNTLHGSAQHHGNTCKQGLQPKQKQHVKRPLLEPQCQKSRAECGGVGFGVQQMSTT